MKNTNEDLKGIVSVKVLKDEINRQKAERGIKPGTRWLKYFLLLLMFLLCIFMVISYFDYKAHKNVLDTRDTRLDSMEIIRFDVVDSINAYLRIASEDDYNSVKPSFNATNEYKSKLFAKKYNPKNFVGAESVINIDAQYTLEDDTGRVKVLAKYLVKSGGKTYTLTVIASVLGNKIVDVLVL